ARATGLSAGLPAGSCHVVRHPFGPFFLDRRGAGLGSRLSGAFGPVPRRVIFSGPPEATRGIRDVVQLPSVLPRDPPTQVVLLLRDGRFPAPVVKRKRIGVHEVLAVHGLITREELRAIYRTSHVAVFPYRFVRTGLPLVVLEAVAAGLPVVTTRIHPIRELEGRTGLVFARPRDPPDIARAIESPFDDAQRAAVVRKNDEWIRSTPGLVAGGSIPMSVAESLAFTVGLTILITALSALAVSIVGIPITEFAVVIVGLPLAVIAFLLRRPATNPWMAFVDFARRLFDFSDYTKGEKGVVAALYVAVVGAVVFLVSLANVHYPDAPSVGLALTGPDGTANSLNRSFVLGQPKSITVTVMGNDTASLYELRIRLVPLNATGTEPFH